MLTVDILEAQNRRLREENDELRETVRQLLERRPSALEAEPLPAGLPYFTKYEEVVLRCILGSKDIATYERIYDELYPRGEDRDPQIVKVMVCRLRKKLAGTSIQFVTVPGRGYRLERDGHGATDAGEARQLISETLAA